MSDLTAHSLQPGLLGSASLVHYEERLPPPELSALIDRLYVLETGAAAQPYPVVADGCADLLFDCSGRRAPIASFSLCRPLPAVVDAGLCLIGARLKPGGIGRLLKTGPAHWDGAVHALQNLPLADRWRLRAERGDPDALLMRLCEQLLPFTRSGPEQELVAQFIGQSFDADQPGIRQDAPGALSDRHLRRLVLRHTGLSPKRFERVRRFQASLAMLARSPATPLADLAAAFSYSDQAHLGHDWRALSGAPPGVWRGRFLQARAQRSA